MKIIVSVRGVGGRGKNTSLLPPKGPAIRKPSLPNFLLFPNISVSHVFVPVAKEVNAWDPLGNRTLQKV